MKCIHCGVDNREGAGFCLNCGAPMSAGAGFQPARPATGNQRALIIGAIILFVVIIGGGVWYSIAQSRGNTSTTTSPIADSEADKRRDEDRDRQTCSSNVKQLAFAYLMYSQDCDETMPLKENWTESIYPYMKNRELFICPSRQNLSVGYAYNSNLAQRSVTQIPTPAQSIMLFESNLGGAEPSDPGDTWLNKVHGDDTMVAYIDGHVRPLQSKPVEASVWLSDLPPVVPLPPPAYPSSPDYNGSINGSTYGSY